MRKAAALVSILAIALAACGPKAERASEAPGGMPMHLTSSAFAPGATIPAEFTCTGAGTSPPLAWTDPPAGTKSFALLVEDPDAPGGIFRHWGVYDIPADLRELPAGETVGTQTTNDFGKTGYGALCPPKGDEPHHYAFRIVALDVAHLSGAPAHASGLVDALDRHVLASTDIVGFYGR